MSLFARYERLLARRPLVVKTALGGTVTFAGDVTAQTLEGGGYNGRRGFALTSLGTVWNGPFMHWYLAALDRRFPQRPGDVRALLSKVAFNQLVANPFLCASSGALPHRHNLAADGARARALLHTDLPLFYCWTGAVAGRTAAQTAEKARREYASTLWATWSIFTPANLVNFWLVPLRHQQSLHVCVSFVYNTTLSLLAAPRARDVGRTRAGSGTASREA
jgi:hypothetical protein